MHRRKAKAFRRGPRRRRPEGRASGCATRVRESCRIKMRVMKNRLKIVTICGIVLLIAAAVVVALRERLQPVPLPEVPVAQTPAEVRVKAVEVKVETAAEGEAATASAAVAIVCGEDATTADRYEARNDAEIVRRISVALLAL